ncbi:MAG: hypothetical protein V7641_1733 [Blastocatellia bacterium]
MKSRISRRSVLNTILPAALVGFAFPLRAKAAVADQPHMQSALDALRLARRELDQATSDKGGHRAKAIRLVNDAINEVEKGIQFDRRH